MTTIVTFLAVLGLALNLDLVLACQPPDCDRPDCGTCGNACCTLELTYNEDSEKVYNTFVDGLKQGGDDGQYTYIGGSDLRPYKVKADFILQGWHQTKVHRYNDTLDFTFSTSAKSCLVRAFSISQIAGAYCDDGQNYKNLIGLAKYLPLNYDEQLITGCPPAQNNTIF